MNAVTPSPALTTARTSPFCWHTPGSQGLKGWPEGLVPEGPCVESCLEESSKPRDPAELPMLWAWQCHCNNLRVMAVLLPCDSEARNRPADGKTKNPHPVPTPDSPAILDLHVLVVSRGSRQRCYRGRKPGGTRIRSRQGAGSEPQAGSSEVGTWDLGPSPGPLCCWPGRRGEIWAH